MFHIHVHLLCRLSLAALLVGLVAGSAECVQPDGQPALSLDEQDGGLCMFQRSAKRKAARVAEVLDTSLDGAEVHIMELDGRGQMRAVLNWTLTLNTDSSQYQFIWHSEDTANASVVVWLMTTITDGDSFRNLKAQHSGAKHVVVWQNPELCDEFGYTADYLEHVFRDADAVVQFGFADSRLVKKYQGQILKWTSALPLGPAFYRGWTTPSPEALPLANQRPLLASFRGSKSTHANTDGVKDYFEKLVEKVDAKRASGNELWSRIVTEWRDGWTGTDSASDASRYHELMGTSKYAFCPFGRNPDSHRVLEAVESNSVPIIVTPAKGDLCYDNWAAMYGAPYDGAGWSFDYLPTPPFVQLPSWSEFNETLLDDEANDRQAQLVQWYADYRRALNKRFSDILGMLVER